MLSTTSYINPCTYSAKVKREFHFANSNIYFYIHIASDINEPYSHELMRSHWNTLLTSSHYKATFHDNS